MIPAARLRVTVRRGLQPGRGELLFVQGKALVSLPGLDLPRWLPGDQVPALLARICGLAPRPVVGSAAILVADRSTVDRYLTLRGGADEAAVRRCFDPALLSDDWVQRLSTMVGQVESHWELAAVAADGTATPWLEVVDAGRAGGLWSIQAASADLLAAADRPSDGDQLVAFAPVSTTAIWAALAPLAAR